MGNLKGKRALDYRRRPGTWLRHRRTSPRRRRGRRHSLLFQRDRRARIEIVGRSETGRRAEIFRADLTKEAEATTLVNSAAGFLGGLDILVNNTGDLVQRRALQEVDMDFWQRVMDVNVTSMMLVTRAALPWLVKAGQASIVNLSSLAGRQGRPFRVAGLFHGQGRRAHLDSRPGQRTRAERRPRQCRRARLDPRHALPRHPHHARPAPRPPSSKSRSAAPERRRTSPARSRSSRRNTTASSPGATLDINGGVYAA